MTLRRTLFYATGLGAATLSACSPPADEPQGPPPADEAPVSRTGGEGEGGPGGEGGGGEYGVDPQAASQNMAVYLSAIEVMRAHYLAGLAALDAGDRAAASGLFSHPISEIYIDFEPVIEARGGVLMGEDMHAAAVLHYQGGEPEAIREAVDRVLALLDENAALAPAPQGAPGTAHAAVLADLIERAALMYPVAIAVPGGDAWLDGFGFARAAEAYLVRHERAISQADPAAASALAAAIAEIGAAYPAAEQPDEPPADATALAAAAQAARSTVRSP